MELPSNERAQHLDTGISAPPRPAASGGAAFSASLDASLFPPRASVCRPRPFSGSRIPSPGRASGPRANPAPRGPRSLTPSGTLRLPRRPRAGGRRCLLCAPLRGARDPRAARGIPSRPPAPPLGVPGPPARLRVPARGALVRSPRRQEEGRGREPPLARRRSQPAGGTRRRPSCGPDCS